MRFPKVVLALAAIAALVPRPAAAESWLTTGELQVFGAGSVWHGLARDGETFTLYAENRCKAELTLDVELQLSNLEAGPYERTRVLPPTGRLVLATMKLQRPKEPYSCGSKLDAQLGSFKAKPVDYHYAIPWSAPKMFRVVRAWNEPPDHGGPDAYAADVAMPVDTEVRAAREGVVAALHADAKDGGLAPAFDAPERANWVVVVHADGTWARYWHLRRGGVKVAVGQRVKRGTPLGASGATGRTVVPHLHFEVGHPLDGKTFTSIPFRWRPAPNGAHDTPRVGEHPAAFEL